MRFPQISFISRHIPISLVSYILFTVFSLSCTDRTSNDSENVNKVIYKLIEADNNSDLESVLHSYTDSVEFYPAGKEFTKGLKNIRANYEKLFKENKLSLTTQISDTKIFGEDAIVTGVNKGTRQSTTDSSTTKIDDKYIAVLLRNNKGEWRIDKLIWGINH